MAEFAAATGQKIWIYNSVNFLRAAKEFNMAKIGEPAIKEISERLASQLERLRDAKANLYMPEPYEDNFGEGAAAFDIAIERLFKQRYGEVLKVKERESSMAANPMKDISSEPEKTTSPNDAEKVNEVEKASGVEKVT